MPTNDRQQLLLCPQVATRSLRVLIACERSGVVRDAFRDRGHDAISCDTEPSEAGGPHLQKDIRDVLESSDQWDLMIGHPPCQFLSSSGLHWNRRRPERQKQTEDALNFVRLLMSADIPAIAIENPVGCISTQIDARDYGFQTSKATQYIQPYEYGSNASKKTGLWLKGLPTLTGTDRVSGRFVEWFGKTVERWDNQTDSGQNRLGPSDTREIDRARTYPGIAAAMAQQWGDWLSVNCD